MEYVSGLLISKLLKENVIQPEAAEVYAYGVRSLLMSVIGFIIILYGGILFQIPFVSIIFYIIYRLTRMYYNGFHAKTRKRCIIYSTITICIALIEAKFIMKNEKILSYLPLIFGILMICMLLTKSIEVIINKSPRTIWEYCNYIKILIVNIVVFQIAYAHSTHAIMTALLLANICTYITYLIYILQKSKLAAC